MPETTDSTAATQTTPAPSIDNRWLTLASAKVNEIANLTSHITQAEQNIKSYATRRTAAEAELAEVKAKIAAGAPFVEPKKPS